MGALACPTLLSPVCNLVGAAGSSVASAGASAVLSAVVTWVAQGAAWLLGQIGGVMTATTAVTLDATWFRQSYGAMAAIAGVVVLPLLLAGAIQAVYRQSAAPLVRAVLVQLPLAALLTGVAIELVTLSLSLTDSLCSAVAGGSAAGLSRFLTEVAAALTAQVVGAPGTAPAFLVLLTGLLVVIGALVLWLELLVRAAAVYVAVLFFPLALATLVWPAISHWCRRLVETLAALVLSKFVIVAVLSLAVGALGSGTGLTPVLAGGALLLLAAFAPFSLLRLVPAVEAGAALHLEAARHRMTHAAVGASRAAGGTALRAARLAGFTAGEPGTMAAAAVVRGAVGLARFGGGAIDAVVGGGEGGGQDSAGASTGESAGGSAGGAVPGDDGAFGVPMWPGNPETNAAFEAALAGPPPPSPVGTGGILPGTGSPPLHGGNLPRLRLGQDPSGMSADAVARPDDDLAWGGAGDVERDETPPWSTPSG